MNAPEEARDRVNRTRQAAERVAARVGGLRATQVVLGVFAFYDAAGGGLTASGLAYTSLIALLPGLLLMAAVFGILIDDPATQAMLVDAIAEAVPPLEELAETAFETLAAGAVPTGIIAFIGLVWGSSRFYAALDYAFTRIFDDAPRRNEVERSIRGVIVTFLLVAVPLGALVFSLVTGWLTSVAPGGLLAAALQVLSPLGSFLLFVTGTVLVFRYVPAKHVPWRALLPPALLVGIVLAAFTQLYVFFAPLLTKMAAIYGTFVAFFAILAWLSISFNILLFGAAWTRVREVGLAGADTPRAPEAGEPASPEPAADQR